MLQGCESLEKCEQLLVSKLKALSFLGEVDYSLEDIEILKRLLGELFAVKGLSEGTKVLIECYPASFAFFLTGIGVFFYKRGNYWSAVEEVIGNIGVGWRRKWGSFFQKFLEENGLHQYELDEAQRFIAPILGHGGIPFDCLDDFWERIILPMAKKGAEGLNEVSYELHLLRERHSKRKEIEANIKDLEQQERLLRNSLKDVREKCRKLVEYRKLNAFLNRHYFILEKTPVDIYGFISAVNQNITITINQVEFLKEAIGNLEETAAIYTEKDQLMLDFSEKIEQCHREYQALRVVKMKLYRLLEDERVHSQQLRSDAVEIMEEEWNDHFGSIFENISLQKFEDKILHCQQLQEKKENSEVSLKQWKKRSRKCAKVVYPLVAALILFTFLFMNAWVLSWYPMLFGAVAAMTWFVSQRRKESFLLSLVIEKDIALQQIISGLRALLQDIPIKEEYFHEKRAVLYQKLCHLKESLHRLTSKRNVISSLYGQIEQLTENIQETAAALSVDDIANNEINEEVVPHLTKALEEAKGKKKIAQQAEVVLQELYHVIQEKHRKRHELKYKLSVIKSTVNALGKGNLEQGKKLLKDLSAAHKKLRELKKELRLEYFEEMHNSRKNLVKDYLAKKQQMFKLNRQRDAEKKKLVLLPELLPQNVDEPIKRFLLYGNRYAGEIFVSSFNAIKELMDNGTFSSEACSLPQRMKAPLLEWWKGYINKRGGRTVDISSIPVAASLISPLLFWDAEMAEVKVYFPPQDLKVTGQIEDLQLIIEADNFKERKKIKGRRTAEKIQTSPFELALPLFFTTIEIVLEINSQPYCVWSLTVLTTQRPYLVFDEAGRELQKEFLPKEKLWLFMPSGYSINDEVEILEEVEVYGNVELYKCYFLDLSLYTGEHFLLENGSLPVTISLDHEELQGVELRGGAMCRHLFLEGWDVYSKPPREIALPLEAYLATEKWAVTIVKNDNENVYSSLFPLADLVQRQKIYIHEKEAVISLAEEAFLGENPCGLFALTVTGEKGSEKKYKIAVLPGLNVDFEHNIYTPINADIPARFRFCCSGLKQFSVQPPAVLFENGNSGEHVVEILPAEEAATGYLLLEGVFHYLQWKIPIPMFKWRIRGHKTAAFSSWQHFKGEIWHGDLIEAKEAWLELQLPEWFDGFSTLSLNDTTQKIKSKVKAGRAHCDLLRFSDTLRQEPKMNKQFLLALESREKEIRVDEIPFLEVITIWEIYDLKISFSTPGEQGEMRFTWKEKGRAEHKVLEIRSLRKPWDVLFHKKLKTEEKKAAISLERDVYFPGRYFVQFWQEDPWEHAKHDNTIIRSQEFQKILTIKDDYPFLEEWSWPDYSCSPGLIRGKVAVEDERVWIKIIALGADGEEIKAKVTETVSDYNGYFQTRLSQNDFSSRWLIFCLQGPNKAESWSAHFFPGAGELSLPLPGKIAENLIKQVNAEFFRVTLKAEQTPFRKAILAGEEIKALLSLLAGRGNSLELQLKMERIHIKNQKDISLREKSYSVHLLLKESSFAIKFEDRPEFEAYWDFIESEKQWIFKRKKRSSRSKKIEVPAELSFQWIDAGIVEDLLPPPWNEQEEIKKELCILMRNWEANNDEKIMFTELIREGKNMEEVVQLLMLREAELCQELQNTFS